MRTIKLKQTINKDECHNGRFCHFVPQSIVEKYADELPKGTTLKVFKGEYKDPKEFVWGFEDDETQGHLLVDSSVIQNIFAKEDLAPMIYGVVSVEDNKRRYVAQVTEEVEGLHETNRERIEEFVKTKIAPKAMGVQVHFDYQPGNVVGDKYVDWQNFKFHDKKDLEHRVKKDWEERTIWKIEGAYQDYPELGIPGRRSVDHRMGIMKVDPRGKTVLDIGCSGGVFVNRYANAGAVLATGYDLPEVVSSNLLMANLQNVFNVDYTDDQDSLQPADIVLFLSMVRHIGYPDWVHDLVKDTLFFEGNFDEVDNYMKILEPKFEQIELLGKATDFEVRPIFKCQKPRR